MHKTLRDVSVKDATKGEVSAVFSTFNVLDHDGDVILPGAIKDGTAVVISAYGHRSHSGALPVGKGVITTTDSEAVLNGQFFMSTDAGRETFEVVKELGELGEWSYSLNDVVAKSGEFEGKPANFIESVFVKEVSPVLMGASIGTRTLETKGLKFSEEGEQVVTSLTAFLGRAREVMVLRAEKGRSLGAESTDLLKQIDDLASDISALLTESATADEVPDDIKALAGEHLRGALFSSLTRNGA